MWRSPLSVPCAPVLPGVVEYTRAVERAIGDAETLPSLLPAHRRHRHGPSRRAAPRGRRVGLWRRFRPLPPDVGDPRRARRSRCASGMTQPPCRATSRQVIIGNALPRSNVEVQAVLDRGLPYTSQAAAFGERFCRSARAVVVAGTHGKTTTTRARRPRLHELRARPHGAGRRRAPGRPPVAAGSGRLDRRRRATSTTPPSSTRGPSFCTTTRTSSWWATSSSTTATSTRISMPSWQRFAPERHWLERDGSVVANLGDAGARAVASWSPAGDVVRPGCRG